MRFILDSATPILTPESQTDYQDDDRVSWLLIVSHTYSAISVSIANHIHHMSWTAIFSEPGKTKYQNDITERKCVI